MTKTWSCEPGMKNGFGFNPANFHLFDACGFYNFCLIGFGLDLDFVLNFFADFISVSVL